MKGGHLSLQVAITLGFANLIADAISMGLGACLRSLHRTCRGGLNYPRRRVCVPPSR